MILYKYLHPHRIDVLKSGRIRFTQPSVLNDPFEMRPNVEVARNAMFAQRIADETILKGSYKILLEAWSGRKNPPPSFKTFKKAVAGSAPRVIRQAVDSIFDNSLTGWFDRHFLVLSLSARPDSRLMWSHYASEHKGFVLGFEQEILEAGMKSIMAVPKALPVKYDNQRFVLPPYFYQLARIVYDQNGETKPLAIWSWLLDEIMQNILTTKSIDWAYEEEVRIFGSASRAGLPDDRNTPAKLIHLFDFPEAAVSEVIFGCKLDQKLKGELSLLVADKFAGATVRQATMSATTFDMHISDPLAPA